MRVQDMVKAAPLPDVYTYVTNPSTALITTYLSSGAIYDQVTIHSETEASAIITGLLAAYPSLTLDNYAALAGE